MKKRILLSLVSFFAMTATWASIIQAYNVQATVAANGKTGATAEIVLNLENRQAIATWQVNLVLPTGVTFESVAAITPGRYPEAYGEPQLTSSVNADGSIRIACEGAEGVALTGTNGAVAVVTVKIAADAPVGDCKIITKDSFMEGPGTDADQYSNPKEYECAWTIEQGVEPSIKGDTNGDQVVNIADAVSVLNVMASGNYNADADVNEDGEVNIADYVTVLNIMAAQ